MPQDTRIALFLMGELVAALRANAPDIFRQWLSGGVQDLGEVLLAKTVMVLFVASHCAEEVRAFD